MLLSRLSQLHSRQEQLQVKRKYIKCQTPIDYAVPAEPSSVLTERVNGRGAPPVGGSKIVMDRFTAPCLSNAEYVVDT